MGLRLSGAGARRMSPGFFTMVTELSKKLTLRHVHRADVFYLTDHSESIDNFRLVLQPSRRETAPLRAPPGSPPSSEQRARGRSRQPRTRLRWDPPFSKRLGGPSRRQQVGRRPDPRNGASVPDLDRADMAGASPGRGRRFPGSLVETGLAGGLDAFAVSEHAIGNLYTWPSL